MEIGDVVRSLRGRDRGRRLLVVGESPLRVLVADGDLRPLRRPKPKNVRHVVKVGRLPEALCQRLRDGPLPGEDEVRKWLEDLQEGGDADAEG